MKRKPVPVFRIGLFVVAGFVLLIIFVFLIGSKENIFRSTVEMHARFVTVNSLKKGAQVQMAGINVGSVTDIRLPKNAEDSVLVTMNIQERALPLIHTDSRAMITTEGLIGDKLIAITTGSDNLPRLAEGSTITGESSKDFTRVADSITAALATVTALSEEARQTIALMRTGNGTIGKLLNDQALYIELRGLAADSRVTAQTAANTVNRIGTDFDRISGNLDKIGSQANDVLASINRGEGSLGKMLKSDELYKDISLTTENIRLSTFDLRDAMAKVALGAGRFAEVTEAFKHNFLVKGYFEERGYWSAPEFEQTIDRKLDSLKTMHETVARKIKELEASRK